MWLSLDIFLVLLNGAVLVGVCVCGAGVAMRAEWAGLLLPVRSGVGVVSVSGVPVVCARGVPIAA
jgi:hypothetical protein